MPKVNVTKFLGYTSKPGMINRPGLATDCGYVIINKGELVNHPGFTDIVSIIATLSDPFRLSSLHILFSVFGVNYHLFHRYSSQPFVIALDTLLSGSFVEFGSSFFNFWPLGFDSNFISIQHGNWVQTGDSVLLVALTLDPFPMIIDEPAESHPEKLPRMLRFTIRLKEDNLPSLAFTQTLVGIKPPRKVILSSISNGADTLNGNYQFAISFCSNINRLSLKVNKTLHRHDLESIAVIDPQTHELTNGKLELMVFLPKNYFELEPQGVSNSSGFILGIYVRKDPQDNFFFSHYTSIQVAPGDLNDGEGFFINLIIRGGNTEDSNTDTTDFATTGVTSTTKTAPLFDRDVPNPSNHGAVFRDRMYYAVANTHTGIWKLNHLEFSQLMGSAGVEANYIEGFLPIGKDDSVITGVIEYLGQLIIFKQNETYVLTADPLTGQGQVRQLFNNNGCVNIDGGHAYIVINNVLYFLDSDGLYAWNGQGDPIEVSEFIQEDLEAIPRRRYKYARLSHDRKYKLIYLTFPYSPTSPGIKEETFIFHYAEGGAWTRFQPKATDLVSVQVQEVLSSNDGRRFMVWDQTSGQHFAELGLLNQPLQPRFLIKSLWQSGRLDMQVPSRQKHWRFLNIGLQELDQTNITVIIPLEFDEVGGDVLTINDNNGKVRISRFLNELTLRFKFEAIGSLTPVFRISGYTLDVNLRGRR